MKYRIVTFLVFGASIFWLAEQNNHQHRLPFTETMDRLWLDFCIANASDRVTEASVTLIQIDDTYEPALPTDYLTRLDYAVILANIEKFNPSAISIVTPLVWSEPNIINQKALQTQAQKMPPLILGSIVENSPIANQENDTIPYPALTHIEGNIAEITPFNRTVSYPEKEALANGSAAFTEIELSKSDNKAGHLTLPLLARHGDKLVPSFILQSIVSYEKLTLNDVVVRLPPVESQGKILIGEKYTIPIDPSGRMKIYEHAAIHPPLYHTLKATELPLAQSEEPEIKALQEELKDEFLSLSDNLLVIGLNRKVDQQFILANGQKVSLADLITRSIATIQSGRYIEQWNLAGRMAGFFVIALLAIWIYRLTRRQVLIWGLLLAFFYTGGCVFLFRNTLLWTPPFTSFALFATLILIGIILPHLPSYPTHTSAPDSLESDGKAVNIS